MSAAGVLLYSAGIAAMACPHATPRADRQQKNIIWERLDDVGGDTDFCDATFKPAAPTSSEDPDHLLALQLARDDEAARERASAPPRPWSRRR